MTSRGPRPGGSYRGARRNRIIREEKGVWSHKCYVPQHCKDMSETHYKRLDWKAPRPKRPRPAADLIAGISHLMDALMQRAKVFG